MEFISPGFPSGVMSRHLTCLAEKLSAALTRLKDEETSACCDESSSSCFHSAGKRRTNELFDE